MTSLKDMSNKLDRMDDKMERIDDKMDTLLQTSITNKTDVKYHGKFFSFILIWLVAITGKIASKDLSWLTFWK